jgi:hypothetical protein
MKIFSLILVISLISTQAFAVSTTTSDGTVCDWSKVVANPDGTYTYSKQLNLCVGKTVQDGQTKDQQIADLHKSVDLYKTTIQTDEQRIQNWITTSVNLENRVEATSSLEKKNEWLYFGLGVAATCAAAYTANKIR